MKQKYIDLYADLSSRIAQLSTATRLQVGAVIVKDHRILSYGYNGTPPGFDNECEFWSDGQTVTKPEVIHAEMNALMKMARHGDSCKDADMFITHAPCIECAKHILQSGIRAVYFSNVYRSLTGLTLLNAGKVPTHQILRPPAADPGWRGPLGPPKVAPK